MPWQETCVVDERMRFIVEFSSGDYSMSELCNCYKISRRTGYKWLARYAQDGPCGLQDQSRAPHSHPHAVTEEVRSAILKIKSRFVFRGAHKIDWQLRREYPRWDHYPAKSTIGELLKNEGLIFKKRRVRKASPSILPLTNGLYSNDVWCVDFKGHFKTDDGCRCNPLTITDHTSRYLLCCRHVDKVVYDAVKRQFGRVFREYGLPLVIRSDNGLPFSSRGIAGISSLSAWWIRLGIHPERIAPGKPQQNGRHERMHATLKQHTASPPAANLIFQQKRFDEFIREYNYLRPHESLNMKIPSVIYTPSCRRLPSKLSDVEYASSFIVRKVAERGQVFISGRELFISECLCGQYIGLEKIEEHKSKLWYCNYELGTFDHKTWRIEQAKPTPLSAGVNPCTVDIT